MFTLMDLAQRSGERVRRLRYIIDNKLVPGLRCRRLTGLAGCPARVMTRKRAEHLLVMANLVRCGLGREVARKIQHDIFRQLSADATSIDVVLQPGTTLHINVPLICAHFNESLQRVPV